MRTGWLFASLLLCQISMVSAQTQTFTDAQNLARAYAASIPCTYDKARNAFVDKNSIIHIFLFEDGNLLISGYPTTATEKDKFQLHLYVSSSNADHYLLEYTGSYTPTLNIENANVPPPAPGPGAAPTPPVRMDFAIIGPFTGSLTLTMKSMKAGTTTYNTLASSTIQIAKTIHASIGSGYVYTSLKNPSNIKILPLPTGDTTLTADDANGRAMLTLMATFYPWGRNNLLIPSWSFKDRFGIVVGTSIGAGATNFQNVYIGGQYDFSIGGSVVAGFHYGRRQKIVGVDYGHFTFGKSKFSGDLAAKEYMSWDGGIFIGIQLDSRIFSQLFNTK